jgi:molybdate transport system substrate-binding protein
MEGIITAGLVEAEPLLFAANRLVLITPSDASLSSLEDLSQQGLRLVLAGPEVPVGNYARTSLERMNTAFGNDFSKRVLANLVSEESNVRQVAAKVELGEADAAIVYATDAAILKNVKTIDIPDDYNVLATYPIAILKETKQLELAQAFVDFLLSYQGQALLKLQGFQTLP